MGKIDAADSYRHLVVRCSEDFFNSRHTLPLIEEFLVRHPRNSHALRLRALVRNFDLNRASGRHRSKLLPLVKRDLEAAIEADTDNILAHLDLAELLEQCGDTAGALMQYEDALERLRRGIFVEDLAKETKAAEAGLASLRGP